jgi:hypothetical protein
MVFVSLFSIFLLIGIRTFFIILGECHLSYIEKKILDPNYKVPFKIYTIHYEPWEIVVSKKFLTKEEIDRGVIQMHITHFVTLLKSLYILYKYKYIILPSIVWK